MDWPIITTERLDQQHFLALARDEIAAICIPGFIDAKTCKEAVEGVISGPIEYYEGVSPRIGKIGITQFEHIDMEAGKDLYFSKVPKAIKTRKQIFSESGDLLDRITGMVEKSTEMPCSPATENGQTYFAGLVRIIHKVLPHIDWAPRDAPGWGIGTIKAQIAWNIHLQTAHGGGAPVVYKRLWRPEDELHKIPGSYSYDRKLIENAPKVKIEPQAGDLVFFNSQNYHEVEETQGDAQRITNSSFIGLTDNNSLVLWS